MGAAWTEVNAVAASEDADLVVVGSRGHRAFSKFFLGSVAERILRTATCPVLVVPEEPVGAVLEGAKKPMRRIVVASDFGEHSQHAVDVGLDLAASLHAKVTVVHVWSIPTILYSLELPPPMIPFEREARDALDAAVADAKRRDPAVNGVLRSGEPSREILAAAHEHDADLIVLGTQLRKGLPRLFLGSVAEHVARMAEVPVLIVSAHDRRVAPR